MPKAALYARYSSDLQSPESIDDQFRICRELAARRSWEVTEIYDDEAISGASIRGRVGMLRLLEDARAGGSTCCAPRRSTGSPAIRKTSPMSTSFSASRA